MWHHNGHGHGHGRGRGHGHGHEHGHGHGSGHGHGASKRLEGNGLVAIAIDKDKGSQNALKFALDHFISKGQTVVLIHFVHKPSHSSSSSPSGAHYLVHGLNSKQIDKATKELFLSFRCYCTRKDVQCLEVLLEDHDIVKAIAEYVSYACIENLVIGASRHGFIRKFKMDMPSIIAKAAPDFCTVYIISKTRIFSVRHATRAAPHASPLQSQIGELNDDFSDKLSQCSLRENLTSSPYNLSTNLMDLREPPSAKPSVDTSFKPPFERGHVSTNKFADFMDGDQTDISFVSSGRPSIEHDSFPGSLFSDSSSYASMSSRLQFVDLSPQHDHSLISQHDGRTSFSSSSHGMQDDLEKEIRRLKLELKQTMDMYSTACKEALTAKQKANELDRWRMEEEQKIEEAKLSEEAAITVTEKEARCKAYMEAAEAAKKIAALEAKRRLGAEMNAMKEAENLSKMMDTMPHNEIMRYRRYDIEEIELATEHFAESRKIGEGGYGPVFRCYLDHTQVAVKVLRPDAAQGRAQFQREVEVLSLIRHPNMVILLGACPEYGILVYEYLAKGSLEDRLFRKGNTPPLSWQLRFRIASEIATGLFFLHQTKPEPLVHRDLKPGNILLDMNYVSKISDVGLARLVPAVAENVTQYRMTATAGTFCYIDPEYQQTGMLGVKSDIYSLGIILLQILTAKPPMGLMHYVERAIENGTFSSILDPLVPDWPVEEALSFAKLALQCAELRRKDRPDLGTVIMPALNKWREMAEEQMEGLFFAHSAGHSSYHSHTSITQDEMSVHSIASSKASETEDQNQDNEEATEET